MKISTVRVSVVDKPPLLACLVEPRRSQRTHCCTWYSWHLKSSGASCCMHTTIKPTRKLKGTYRVTSKLHFASKNAASVLKITWWLFRKFSFEREKWGLCFSIHFKENDVNKNPAKVMRWKEMIFGTNIIFEEWHILLQLSLNFSLWKCDKFLISTQWISDFVSCYVSICTFPSGHSGCSALASALCFLFSPRTKSSPRCSWLRLYQFPCCNSDNT